MKETDTIKETNFLSQEELRALTDKELSDWLHNYDQMRNVATSLLITGAGALAASFGVEEVSSKSPAVLTLFGGTSLLIIGTAAFTASLQAGRMAVEEIRRRGLEIKKSLFTRRIQS